MGLTDRIKSISLSETLEITSKAKQLQAQGVEVLSLAAGEPDFDTPIHIKEAAIQAINEGFTKYTPPSGILELKQAICKEIFESDGLRYDTSEVVVSCGAKHALYNILQVLVQRRDEVIIISPYWVSYPSMVTLAEATPVIVKTRQSNNFVLEISDLESVINKNTRVLIINSPSNPTGVVYNVNLLKKIAKLVLKYKIIVISDEIYKDIVYDGLKVKSIASVYKDVKKFVIIVRGVSKKYSMTGWRIGYALGPVAIMKSIDKLQSHSTSNPTSISQKAALSALSAGQACVTEMVAEFRKRRDFIMQRMQGIKGLTCIRPEGAFYVFCDISKFGLDSVQFAKDLLDEQKVAVIPGRAFGEDGFIRISFATSISVLSAAFDRLEKFFKKRR